MEKYHNRMMAHFRSKASHGQRSLIDFAHDLRASILMDLVTDHQTEQQKTTDEEESSS